MPGKHITPDCEVATGFLSPDIDEGQSGVLGKLLLLHDPAMGLILRCEVPDLVAVFNKNLRVIMDVFKHVFSESSHVAFVGLVRHVEVGV